MFRLLKWRLSLRSVVLIFPSHAGHLPIERQANLQFLPIKQQLGDFQKALYQLRVKAEAGILMLF